MKRLFEALKSVLNQGGDAVLVTVAASSGSTPRGAGARMLVTGAGRIYGTIGGGGVEHYAEQLALEVLAAKRSRMERFVLRKNQVQDLGMVCIFNIFRPRIRPCRPLQSTHWIYSARGRKAG